MGYRVLEHKAKIGPNPCGFGPFLPSFPLRSKNVEISSKGTYRESGKTGRPNRVSLEIFS
jgi:hypothetical protein